MSIHFAAKFSGQGATVLIDTSGSMSLNVEQVEEIVRAVEAIAAMHSE